MRIRSLRKARGWSLDDLAERAGISLSQLSRIETGHRRISLDQLTAISVALGKSLDELVESPDDLGAHPGRDWFTVLSGTVVLYLGERSHLHT
jgi:transcriptional regulator with XRE-family HTH domain